jgi:hypothetical protein
MDVGAVIDMSRTDDLKGIKLNNRYITYRLGDNDFSSAMFFAMDTMRKDFVDILANDRLDVIKEMIIQLMVGYTLAKSAGRYYSDKTRKDPYKFYYDYFNDGSISNSVEACRDDANHSAVSIDLNMGVDYIWIH